MLAEHRFQKSWFTSGPQSLTDMRHPLLPGLHPRHRAPPDRRSDRRDGHPRADDRRGLGGLLGVCLQLLQLRLRRGAPRARPGHGHRHQARAARPDRLHLPGRRRPGLHRHGRDRARRRPRREHHRHLHQQRQLRHDRRADGPHHPARAEDHLLAQRAGRGDRWATPSARAELLATLDGAGYVVRRSLHDPKNIRLAKKAIRTAFEAQVRGLGFSMVELLSTCPTNWGMTPLQSLQWLRGAT